jgi:hypothetical protein
VAELSDRPLGGKFRWHSAAVSDGAKNINKFGKCLCRHRRHQNPKWKHSTKRLRLIITTNGIQYCTLRTQLTNSRRRFFKHWLISVNLVRPLRHTIHHAFLPGNTDRRSVRVLIKFSTSRCIQEDDILRSCSSCPPQAQIQQISQNPSPFNSLCDGQVEFGNEITTYAMIYS